MSGWEAPAVTTYRRHHRLWAISLGCALFGMGALGGLNGAYGIIAAVVFGGLFMMFLLALEVDDAVTHGAWEQHEHEYELGRKRTES